MEYNITIFGKKGFGKTCWIWWYIENHPDDLYIVMDHFDEYSELSNSIIFSSIREFLDYPYTLEILRRDPGMPNVIIFQGEIDFSKFFELVTSIGNCVVVFDEIDKCCSAYNLDKNLNRIIQYGRHMRIQGKIKWIKLLSASRRPANVSRNLTSQADRVIIFRITEPNDIKYLEEYTSKNIAEKAPYLNVLHYVEYPTKEIEG